MQTSDRRGALAIAGVSVIAISLVMWLTTRPPAALGVNLSFMPAINAGFNLLSALLLTLGWRAIRAGDKKRHQRLMSAAFVSSTLFFVGYLAYHYAHGDVRYEGSWRAGYLVILVSHIVLSVALVPMALTTLYLAASGRFSTHKKIARWTLPIWLYVSVTGVLVFLLLHVL